MKTIWNEADRRALQDRLHRLEPGTPRVWGTMSAAQMVAHLADALRMALGELPCQRKKRAPPLPAPQAIGRLLAALAGRRADRA
jgi:hypothetical protein